MKHALDIKKAHVLTVSHHLLCKDQFAQWMDAKVYKEASAKNAAMSTNSKTTFAFYQTVWEEKMENAKFANKDLIITMDSAQVHLKEWCSKVESTVDKFIINLKYLKDCVYLS